LRGLMTQNSLKTHYAQNPGGRASRAGDGALAIANFLFQILRRGAAMDTQRGLPSKQYCAMAPDKLKGIPV
jgi:hypothetical protein